MTFHSPAIATIAIALAALSQGCVGYNTTMFVSKSNAGIDIDAQPPTSAFSISREEGVIAPTFHAEATPPVMASFATETEWSKRFFVGVDQTFSGGDAAVTLSKLYNAPTFTNSSSTEFDSTMSLSQNPNENLSGNYWKKRLFGLSEPGEMRSLVFGTDTQLGAKIGRTSDGARIPKSLKIGFNLEESVIAPITSTESVGHSGKPEFHVKMPSFLATFQAGLNSHGTEGTDLAFRQYYAIGLAANALARQGKVREAMIKLLDPDERKQPQFDTEATNATKALESERESGALKILEAVNDGSGHIDAARLGKAFNLTPLHGH